MKQSSIDLAKALYKAGYINVDILTKEGKISAKDIVNKQASTQTNIHILKCKKKGKR